MSIHLLPSSSVINQSKLQGKTEKVNVRLLSNQNHVGVQYFKTLDSFDWHMVDFLEHACSLRLFVFQLLKSLLITDASMQHESYRFEFVNQILEFLWIRLNEEWVCCCSVGGAIHDSYGLMRVCSCPLHSARCFFGLCEESVWRFPRGVDLFFFSERSFLSWKVSLSHNL